MKVGVGVPLPLTFFIVGSDTLLVVLVESLTITLISLSFVMSSGLTGIINLPFSSLMFEPSTVFHSLLGFFLTSISIVLLGLDGIGSGILTITVSPSVGVLTFIESSPSVISSTVGAVGRSS